MLLWTNGRARNAMEGRGGGDITTAEERKKHAPAGPDLSASQMKAAMNEMDETKKKNEPNKADGRGMEIGDAPN